MMTRHAKTTAKANDSYRATAAGDPGEYESNASMVALYLDRFRSDCTVMTILDRNVIEANILTYMPVMAEENTTHLQRV